MFLNHRSVILILIHSFPMKSRGGRRHYEEPTAKVQYHNAYILHKFSFKGINALQVPIQPPHELPEQPSISRLISASGDFRTEGPLQVSGMGSLGSVDHVDPSCGPIMQLSVPMSGVSSWMIIFSEFGIHIFMTE